MKSIAIISDASTKINISGVVTWLVNTEKILEQSGFKVTIIDPTQFPSFSLPTYPEYRNVFYPRKKLADILNQIKPDYIHISTEFTLGVTARIVCAKNNWKFTTFAHTRLSEYAQIYFKTFGDLSYRHLRWFHNAGVHTMVTTESFKRELEEKQLEHLVITPYGLDLSLFRKNPEAAIPSGLRKPIFTYMGRISSEKNLEAFLRCRLPGIKLVIGDGPAKAKLEKKYRGGAVFTGYKKGEELADLLSISDVFVFPSKTDTFGLVIIEALACGLPVAAYDVQGPKDIITNGEEGFLGDDLENNAKKCLTEINREKCLKKAREYSWENSVKIFVDNLSGSENK